MEPVSALVLAAGLSRRMGRNKMLLPFRDTSVLGQVIETLQACPLAHILVVTGHEADKIRELLGPDRALNGGLGPCLRLVHNPAYATGEMFSSIQAGLSALQAFPGCQAALITLGDQPHIQAATVERVLQAWRRGRTQQAGRVVIPSYQRHGGHPILIDRACWEGILALPPSATLRDAWRAHPDWPYYIDVDTDTILRDLDTPEDYGRWG